MELTDDIGVIKGIGEKTEILFHKLGIFTIQDLLEHYPRNYDVYKEIVMIHSVMEGQVVIIEASLHNQVELKRVKNLQIANCIVKDGTGSIKLTWFNMPFIKKLLKMGTKYIFRGKVVKKNGMLVMEQPVILSKEEYYNGLNVLRPIYPLTKGITNNLISKTIKNALLDIELKGDYLSKEIRNLYDLIDYKSATKGIHFPKSSEQMMCARKRIVFNEFFLFTLALNYLKDQKNTEIHGVVLNKTDEAEVLIQQLPYDLTNAQHKVWDEIKVDLASGRVMHRLIQGDVGSGKTIVAILALLTTVKSGYQGSFMVPTEVLAKQHYISLQKELEQFDVKIELLVGSMTAKEKKVSYEKIKNGEVQIIVGTHALIQEKVEYNNLGLVITDEQHRFGVRQREALALKGEKPHIMVMSATPIPRTLAIILYGDLDISIIDELPANRLPIKNCVVDTNYRKTAYHFIEKEVLSGRQAYVICPMVEESENIEAENVIDYTEELRRNLAPVIKVEYLHGKMKPKEKNEIMERFAANEINVLVSTTVIEVGVNVPNATVMMIENAERFGLAGLHQLRGRVGRGDYQSYCILVSGVASKDTKERLEILNKSNDGFYIANEDLKLRGPGDVFGIRQSGEQEFKMADIYTDAKILKDANEAARSIDIETLNKMCKNNKNLKLKIESIVGNTLL